MPVTVTENYQMKKPEADYTKNVERYDTQQGPRDITEQETVAGQLSGLLSKGSPLMTQARTRSKQEAQRRGLLSSAMAVQAGEMAAMNTALPIAQTDAGTYAQSGLSAQQAGEGMRASGLEAEIETGLIGTEYGQQGELSKLEHGQAKDLSAQESTQRITEHEKGVGVSTEAEKEIIELMGGEERETLGVEHGFTMTEMGYEAVLDKKAQERQFRQDNTWQDKQAKIDLNFMKEKFKSQGVYDEGVLDRQLEFLVADYQEQYGLTSHEAATELWAMYKGMPYEAMMKTFDAAIAGRQTKLEYGLQGQLDAAQSKYANALQKLANDGALTTTKINALTDIFVTETQAAMDKYVADSTNLTNLQRDSANNATQIKISEMDNDSAEKTSADKNDAAFKISNDTINFERMKVLNQDVNAYNADFKTEVDKVKARVAADELSVEAGNKEIAKLGETYKLNIKNAITIAGIDSLDDVGLELLDTPEYKLGDDAGYKELDYYQTLYPDINITKDELDAYKRKFSPSELEKHLKDEYGDEDATTPPGDEDAPDDTTPPWETPPGIAPLTYPEFKELYGIDATRKDYEDWINKTDPFEGGGETRKSSMFAIENIPNLSSRAIANASYEDITAMSTGPNDLEGNTKIAKVLMDKYAAENPDTPPVLLESLAGMYMAAQGLNLGTADKKKNRFAGVGGGDATYQYQGMPLSWRVDSNKLDGLGPTDVVSNTHHMMTMAREFQVYEGLSPTLAAKKAMDIFGKRNLQFDVDALPGNWKNNYNWPTTGDGGGGGGLSGPGVAGGAGTSGGGGGGAGELSGGVTLSDGTTYTPPELNLPSKEQLLKDIENVKPEYTVEDADAYADKVLAGGPEAIKAPDVKLDPSIVSYLESVGINKDQMNIIFGKDTSPEQLLNTFQGIWEGNAPGGAPDDEDLEKYMNPELKADKTNPNRILKFNEFKERTSGTSKDYQEYLKGKEKKR